MKNQPKLDIDKNKEEEAGRKMDRIQTIGRISLTGLISVVLYFILVHFVLYPILIPDECYYHSHDTPILIDLLFDFPASEGFHPVPRVIGYILSVGIGIVLAQWWKKKQQSQKS